MILDVEAQVIKPAKALVTLSQDVTQLLIDSEIFYVTMGLTFQLRCVPCALCGDTNQMFCVGGVSADEKAFTVTCGCTERVGRGEFTVPPVPSSVHPFEKFEDGHKREMSITRDQMKQIEAFETVLKSLKLQYLIRCMRCEMSGEPSGVYGVKNSVDFVLECACAKRTYKGGASQPTLAH